MYRQLRQCQVPVLHGVCPALRGFQYTRIEQFEQAVLVGVLSLSEHIKDSISEEDGEIKPTEKVSVQEVQKLYFPTNSKLFYIGDGKMERGFLSHSLERFKELHEDTVDIIAV